MTFEELISIGKGRFDNISRAIEFAYFKDKIKDEILSSRKLSEDETFAFLATASSDGAEKVKFQKVFFGHFFGELPEGANIQIIAKNQEGGVEIIFGYSSAVTVFNASWEKFFKAKLCGGACDEKGCPNHHDFKPNW